VEFQETSLSFYQHGSRWNEFSLQL
jgi:hypothetical protein